MPSKEPSEMNEEELRHQFLYMGTEFFKLNAHSRVPDILNKFSDRLEAASEASGKLSKALNSLTLALVIVGAIGLVIQGAYVFCYIWAYLHPKVM